VSAIRIVVLAVCSLAVVGGVGFLIVHYASRKPEESELSNESSQAPKQTIKVGAILGGAAVVLVGLGVLVLQILDPQSLLRSPGLATALQEKYSKEPAFATPTNSSTSRMQDIRDILDGVVKVPPSTDGLPSTTSAAALPESTRKGLYPLLVAPENGATRRAFSYTNESLAENYHLTDSDIASIIKEGQDKGWPNEFSPVLP
jgi:hypothetical protein